ncbi:S-adenosyl-L-methionine-dependent methyltransferase [Xylaria sp. CBS 124048]|nr:S-adenosyl-L-methionine-dependent methyltransferase [Xylaria sp. CBS 124048]
MEDNDFPMTTVKHEWDNETEESPIEEESAEIERQVKELLERFRHGTSNPIQIDPQDDNGVDNGVDNGLDNGFGDGFDDEDEANIIPALEHVIDLTDIVSGDTPPPPQRRPTRPDLVKVEDLTQSYRFNGSVLEPGVTVEIQAQNSPQFFKSSFLYINQIINTLDGIKLRGIAMTRLRNLRGRLPRLRNELAMILHVDNTDSRPEEVQGAIEVSVRDVIRVRNCHFTNADYPVHRAVSGIYATVADLENQGVLMCRWRLIFVYRDAITRKAYIEQTKRAAAPLEYIIEHLSIKQISKKRFKVSETSRFNAWRGGKIRGGEHDPTNNNNGVVTGPIIQLDDDNEEDPDMVLIEKKRGQRYTFGDMFCGAGGASLGARKAGFRIKIACDHHKGACATYSRVFPEAELHHRDIFDFITTKDSLTRVDVLHLSPPCQFWSPAHTCAGINDEANIAALFSCHGLIKKFRPRLFTLEQTYGILLPKFEYYFNALVHGFTENNYSVRWKIVDLVEWGSPATRKRLVMIGSCPGEELPVIPKASHVPRDVVRRGKKPYLTVKKMLERIPRELGIKKALNANHANGPFGNGHEEYEDPLHRPYEMIRKYMPRWDPDVTLRRCITTNGGYGNYHPHGRRDFTLREYAVLQTFPVNYPFQLPDRKIQIGNAFPPMVVKVLFTHLRRWLERQDGVYAVENEPLDPDDPDVEFCDLEALSEDEKKNDSMSRGVEIEYMGQRPVTPDVDSMDIDTDDENDNDKNDNDDDNGKNPQAPLRVWFGLGWSN